MRAICCLIAGNVAAQRVVVEQVALVGASTGIADHSRGAPRQSDRRVPVCLEAAQGDEADQIAVWRLSAVGSQP